jgi:dynein heavy chain
MSQFSSVDAIEITKSCEKYAKISTRVSKTLPENYIQMKLQESVETFTGAMPIVTALRNPNLNESHWEEIRSIVGQNLDVNSEEFTLQSLIDLDVVKH